MAPWLHVSLLLADCTLSDTNDLSVKADRGDILIIHDLISSYRKTLNYLLSDCRNAVIAHETTLSLTGPGHNRHYPHVVDPTLCCVV